MRRIQRDVSHEELIKSLTTGDTAIFREIWRVLLFAAAIGVSSGIRRPLTKADSGKAINDSSFGLEGWRGFLYLLGLSETGSSEYLHANEFAEDALATLFEEYSNQGLYLISEKVSATILPLDALVELILEHNKRNTDAPDLDLQV